MKILFFSLPQCRECRGSPPKIVWRGMINIFNLRTEQPTFHATNPQDSQQYGFVYLVELSLGYNFGYIQIVDLSMKILIFRYDFWCRFNTKTMALLSLLELVEKLSQLGENEVWGWLFITQTKKTNERLFSSYLADPCEARDSYTTPLLLITVKLVCLKGPLLVEF